MVSEIRITREHVRNQEKSQLAVFEWLYGFLGKAGNAEK
jgi:hypothetical protein